MPLTRYSPDAAHRYIVVTGTGQADRIDPYLYDTAARAVTVQNLSRFQAVVLVQTELADEVDYIARYQAERLRSGLYGAEVVDSFPEALFQTGNADLIGHTHPEDTV